MFVVHRFEECQHVRVIGDVVPAYDEAYDYSVFHIGFETEGVGAVGDWSGLDEPLDSCAWDFLCF